MEKKTQQHYVWEYYLKSWCHNEKQLYCLREKEKIFTVNPEKIAKEREFYKLKNISKNEANLIDKAFIEPQKNERLKILNRKWVHHFTEVFEIQKHIEKTEDAQLNYLIEAIVVNLEEDYHNKLENIALPYIEALKKGDLNLIQNNEEDYHKCLIFIATQYFRTKKMKENAIKSTEDFTKKTGYKTEKIWNILSHIFATNLAFGLLQKREEYKWYILDNRTHTPFLTGDQPIINTHSDYSSFDNIEEELELYYPISPSKALLISDNNYGDPSNIEIKIDKVNEYNSLISRACHEQLFSNKKELLNEFMNL